MILQAITDNLTALNLAVTTLSTKVDALLVANAGSATPAEQQTVADSLASTKAAVDAISAKLP